MDYENMSDYEIKATVLGFHPEHGELIAASEAKEAIAHFNDIAKAELAKANDYTAELEVRKEALEESLNGCTEKVLSLSGKLAKANERVAELESYNVKLANESHEYQERCAELEKELTNKDLLHVGFTNGAQIKYAKDEEGAFYHDTDGDCYIPLYMLKSHEHRIETTSIEQLRKEQEGE